MRTRHGSNRDATDARDVDARGRGARVRPRPRSLDRSVVRSFGRSVVRSVGRRRDARRDDAATVVFIGIDADAAREDDADDDDAARAREASERGGGGGGKGWKREDSTRGERAR